MPNLNIMERMKNQYEDRYRIRLPRRTYTVVRADGVHFHTTLRRQTKPFDAVVAAAMQEGARNVLQGSQGCVLCYTQSDEASFLFCDFARPETEAWYDGNLQKIASVTASMMTVGFNRVLDLGAVFDARAFVIPDYIEVGNYFIGRQVDAIRNAKSACRRWGADIDDQEDSSVLGAISAGTEGVFEPIDFTKDQRLIRNLIPIIWELAEDENK